MKIVDKFFSKKCQLCDKRYNKIVSEKIHLQTADGILKLKICSDCANQLSEMKLKDLT